MYLYFLTNRVPLQVIVGGYLFLTHDDTEQLATVQSRFIHPYFRANSNDYNFALLKLTRQIIFNDNVKKICNLPETCLGESRPGSFCSVSGWNIKLNNGELQKNWAKIGWDFECRTVSAHGLVQNLDFTDRQLCVGYPTIPFDDQYEFPQLGQPLVCQSENNNGTFFLNGIFSHRNHVGTQRAENGTIMSTLVTDIYGRPCAVMDFIERIISELN